MYRVIPKKWIFLAIVWPAIGCLLLLDAINGLAHTDWFKPSAVPTIIWLVANLLFWKPVWRWVWKRAPILNRVLFPDLNGIWDVEMQSNWPIHEQLISAAAGHGASIDFNKCSDDALAPLQRVMLKAEIDQSWLKIEIRMWNPAGNTPIDRSDVIVAEPFPAIGLKPGGLFYFFKQINRRQSLADDNEFYGAARVEYDQKSDTLNGHFWTARMWERAMNTAGLLTYRRSSEDL